MPNVRKLIVVLIATGIALFTFCLYSLDMTDYGVTWDEFFHRGTGKRYLEFITTRDMKKIDPDTIQTAWLPPVASTIGYAISKIPQLPVYFPLEMDRFHLAALLFSSITSALVYLISYHLFRNHLFALVSVVLLIFHPQFSMHGHTNVRDMGLVMFYTATIFALQLSMQSRHKIISMAIAGIFAGITTDAKQSGSSLVLVSLIWFFLHLKNLGIKKLLIGSVLFLVFYCLSVFLFWPYLWVDTFDHLKKVLDYLHDPAVIGGLALFYDRTYRSLQNIPWYLPWGYLGIVTTPFVVLFGIIGFWGSISALKNTNKENALLFLWLFVPLSRFLYPNFTIAYDQIRHFIEILPSIPVLASYGAYRMYQRYHENKFIQRVILLFIFITVGYSSYIFAIYRPYGNAYFNFLAGPSHYVNSAFDVEFWGNVYRIAAAELNTRYGTNVSYYIPGVGVHLLREDGLLGTMTENRDDTFDYVIFMNKQTWLRNNTYVMWLLKNKNPKYTIERGGKILFYLFKPYKEEYQDLQS